MHHVEASGKTREEAIQNALSELGVEMHEVERIEVLNEGSKGLFGFGARPVMVKVSVDKAPPRKAPTREHAPERNDDRRDERKRPQEQGGRDNQGGRERQGNRDNQGGRERQGNRDNQGNRENQGGREDNKNGRGRGERPQREQKPRENREKNENRAPREQGDNESPSNRPPRERKERDPAADAAREAASFEPISDEQGQEAATLLTEIIAKMGMQAEVKFERNGDQTARLTVSSEDGAILIGRKGRTLGALQYIINRVISRGDTAENTERLLVDVEGYVDRRRESLEELARNFAEKVKASGRNFKLKPMSPQERRIIHLTLQDDPEIRTFSLGDSLYRTVVVSLANGQSARSGNRNRGRGNSRGRGGRGRRPAAEANRRDDNDTDPGTFGD